MNLSTHMIRRLVIGLAVAGMATVAASPATPASRALAANDCRVIESVPSSIPNPGDGWRFRYLMTERRGLSSVPNPGDGWRYRYLTC